MVVAVVHLRAFGKEKTKEKEKESEKDNETVQRRELEELGVAEEQGEDEKEETIYDKEEHGIR